MQIKKYKGAELWMHMIYTKSLLIRELIPEDWQEVQNIVLDLQKSEYAIYDMSFPVRDEEIRALTKQFAESHLFFAVMFDGIMIGYVCFHEKDGIFDLGYCFHSDVQQAA